MLFRTLITFLFVSIASANLFDFFQNQFQGQQQEQQVTFEDNALDSKCGKYLCSDTLACVAGPNDCPCPFPSSLLRCVIPNGQYICISKPAGDFAGKYDDPSTNWRVDANDNNVRDCGWVKRAWAGKI